MSEITRILCPVDFSEHSRHAVDYAIAIAGLHGGAVTALHVLTPIVSLQPVSGAPLYPPITFTPDDLEQFRLETARFVEAARAGVPVDALVLQGNPAGEIVEVARTLPADMIVMGTHGRSGFERLMLGSVAERVLRKAPCPVLTVPPRAPDAGPGRIGAFRRILCAVDFSPSAVKGFEFALSLARRTGAALTAVHIVEVVPVVEPVAIGDREIASFEQRRREASRLRLHDLVSVRAGASDDTAIREVLGEGKPYREILRVAAEQASDLIVVGVHGGAAGLITFGSTTNHVVREATCPVLSLRA